MTISPKKQGNKKSNFTSSTANKGVHARNTETANLHSSPDMSVTNSVEHTGESSTASLVMNAARTGTETETVSQLVSPVTDDTASSYIQVLVQKHHKKRESLTAAAQTSPRLPTASSPLKPEHDNVRGGCGDGNSAPAADATAPGVYVLPHPVLFSYPPQQHHDMQAHFSCPNASRRQYVEMSTSARSSTSFKRLVRAARRARPAPRARPPPHAASPPAAASVNSFWKKIGEMSGEQCLNEEGAERVEVFYFSGGGAEHLAACGAAAAARGGAARWAARGERLADRLLAELCAPARCLLMVPVHLLLHAQRLAWDAVRGAAVGSLQVAGDHLLKPALATAFNALVQPPLLCAAHVTRALRDALRPVWAALGDALEPCARLLQATRLVHVQLDRRAPHDV